MRLSLSVLRWLHRRKLSRQGLRGGFLHSKLGDRLLAKELWRPTRESMARAWSIGWMVTIIPFLPAQSVIAGVVAFFARGNLLLAVGLQFLSNPATAPIHLPACYFVGRVLLGHSPAEVVQHLEEDWRRVFSAEAALALYLGAVVLGLLGSIVGYVVIRFVWPDHLFGDLRRRAKLLAAKKDGGGGGASAP